MSSTEIRKASGYAEFSRDLPSGKRATVTVFGPNDLFPEREWEVNWSALGSVGAEDAAAYAALISEAAEYAERKGVTFNRGEVRKVAAELWFGLTDDDGWLDRIADAAYFIVPPDVRVDPNVDDDQAAEIEIAAEDAIMTEIGRFLISTKQWEEAK